MKPTVGRIIHVFDTYTSDGTHSVLGQLPLAAIVTAAPAGVEVEAADERLVPAIGVTIFVSPPTTMAHGAVPINVASYLPAEPGVKLGNARGTYWQWPTREEG